jgi:hypothetical protein
MAPGSKQRYRHYIYALIYIGVTKFLLTVWFKKHFKYFIETRVVVDFKFNLKE